MARFGDGDRRIDVLCGAWHALGTDPEPADHRGIQRRLQRGLGHRRIAFSGAAQSRAFSSSSSSRSRTGASGSHEKREGQVTESQRRRKTLRRLLSDN
jgi:hypothetical protein